MKLSDFGIARRLDTPEEGEEEEEGAGSSCAAAPSSLPTGSAPAALGLGERAQTFVGALFCALWAWYGGVCLAWHGMCVRMHACMVTSKPTSPHSTAPFPPQRHARHL